MIDLTRYSNKAVRQLLNSNPTLEKIQEFAEEVLDWTIWDYPLDELEDVLENHDGNEDELVLVRVDDEVRICEI